MKKYKWLQFDVDNTLLDFSKASKESLFKTYEDYSMQCNEEVYSIYKTENAKVWVAFEEKKINTTELRKIRFAEFFNVMGIKGIDPFEFNAQYLQNLVAVSQAYNGAVELVDELRQDYLVSIITNGLKEVQRPRLKQVGMIDLFHSIVVSDEINIAKPDVGFFEHTYDTIDNPPHKSEILVVGDNLMSDILGGHNFGVDTCWISHGKENSSSVKPTYSIDTVFDIESVL